MRLNLEPAKSLRAVIGDEKSDELGRYALEFCKRNSPTPDELLYLSLCFDYLGLMSADAQEYRLEQGEA